MYLFSEAMSVLSHIPHGIHHSRLILIKIIETTEVTHICAKLFQFCLTVFNPMDSSPPGFSVHGVL